jgi:hypothetical protein
MGKRGPKPKGPFEQRTTMFSTRLRTDTRALLTEASRAANRSVSQELETRLRQTFRQNEQERALYGDDEKIAGVVRLIAATINLVVQQAFDKRKRDFLGEQGEQWLFDMVLTAVVHALLLFRPGGDKGMTQFTLGTGTDLTDQLLAEIQDSDPTLPIEQRTDRQHAAAKLKQKLGPLIEREHPYWKYGLGKGKKRPRPVVLTPSDFLPPASQKTKAPKNQT